MEKHRNFFCSQINEQAYCKTDSVQQSKNWFTGSGVPDNFVLTFGMICHNSVFVAVFNLHSLWTNCPAEVQMLSPRNWLALLTPLVSELYSFMTVFSGSLQITVFHRLLCLRHNRAITKWYLELFFPKQTAVLIIGKLCEAGYSHLSHALKNSANQRPRLPLHILRYATGNMQRVVFHSNFPSFLARNSLLGSIRGLLKSELQNLSTPANPYEHSDQIRKSFPKISERFRRFRKIFRKF